MENKIDYIIEDTIAHKDNQDVLLEITDKDTNYIYVKSNSASDIPPIPRSLIASDYILVYRGHFFYLRELEKLLNERKVTKSLVGFADLDKKFRELEVKTRQNPNVSTSLMWDLAYAEFKRYVSQYMSVYL